MCSEKEFSVVNSPKIVLPSFVLITLINEKVTNLYDVITWKGLVPGLGGTNSNKARYMAQIGVLTNKVRIRVSNQKLSISSSVCCMLSTQLIF